MAPVKNGNAPFLLTILKKDWSFMKEIISGKEENERQYIQNN